MNSSSSRTHGLSGAVLVLVVAAAALAACGREPEQGAPASVPGTSQGSTGSVSGEAAPGTSGSTSPGGGPGMSSSGTGATGAAGTGTSGMGASAPAGAGAASGISGSGTSAAPGAGAAPSAASAPSRKPSATGLSPAGRSFLINAVTANMAEIRAARMAADKASDAGVKAYGLMLVEQHGKAGEELVRIAKLHDVPTPEQLPAPKRQALEKLSRATGNDFDRLFVQQVGIKDHQEAIRMLESARITVKNAELKAWIEKTLPSLREHLAQAQKLPSGGARGSSGDRTG